MTEPISVDAAIQELRDNKAQMTEFFASKGWELWLKWSESALSIYKDNSIAAETVAEREDNRAKYQALKYFNQLPFFLMQQAESVPANEAPKIP